MLPYYHKSKQLFSYELLPSAYGHDGRNTMRKILRVFTTVNFSAGENVYADSGFTHLTVLIRTLILADENLHFYILVPEDHLSVWRGAVECSRVTVISAKLTRRLHGGDFEFNPQMLLELGILKSFDFDLLFFNQLETIPAYMNFFNRLTFHNLPAVGYIHWFDTRRPSTPRQHCHEPALLAGLAGMSSATFVGCNSAHAKARVLDSAKRWYSARALDELDEKLRILPPMITQPQAYSRSRRSTDCVRVVVNHRMLKYTGVRPLLEEKLPKIWAGRRDFHVHVTNPSRNRLPKRVTDVPWMTVETLEPAQYGQLLSSSDIVIAPHRSTDWSMSTLEAICAGAVPLMNRESFFPEMLKPILAELSGGAQKHILENWFYYRQQFRQRFEAMLDNIEMERVLAQEVEAIARRVYDPLARARDWVTLFRVAADTTPSLSQRNPSVARIRKALAARGAMDKAELLELMRWRPQTRTIAWTSLRKALLEFSEDDPTSSSVRYMFTGSEYVDATSVLGGIPRIPPEVLANRKALWQGVL